MSLKPKLEAIIYAAETPITLDQIVQLVRDSLLADGASDDADVRSRVREVLDELVKEYDSSEHGMEIRQVAGGYRMSTKPEHHDAVRSFAKSLKPPIRLSLQALETLAVIAYKQPVTAPEISEIRGVDASGVLGTLIDRKLITTAGRKDVIGRPILYKTTKEFLLRFGLNDMSELPSMEEFEKLARELFELFHAGQLAHVVESEAQQEFLGGLIEDRTADNVFASGGGDELAIDERAEDAGCVDAADLADLGRSDRLLVGDDGEGFQGRQREPDGRLQALGEGAHRVVMLGLGGHAEAVGDVADLHAAVFAGVVLDELVDGGAHGVLGFLAGFGG